MFLNWYSEDGGVILIFACCYLFKKYRVWASHIQVVSMSLKIPNYYNFFTFFLYYLVYEHRTKLVPLEVLVLKQNKRRLPAAKEMNGKL